jgi:hypothetical protein
MGASMLDIQILEICHVSNVLKFNATASKSA